MAPKRQKSPSRKTGVKGKVKDNLTPSPMEKPDHPDDIYPIVLTTATQELFECCIDEDVTEQSPYKLLEKDDIIQDIKTRAAVSDFHPVKQFVLDYPEDEILLVFDVDFTYGQSFYLVLTPEAKARIYNVLQPPQPEIIVLEDDVSKTPEPKPWISLGSELEVDQESVKETREKLCYKFDLKRRPGLPVCFSDRNSTEAECRSVACPSYQDSRFSIKQMQRDCGMQAVPKLQSSTAQTERAVQRNVFTQYEPRELREKEKENILRSEKLKKFVNSVTPRVLHALQQTHIMNVFTDDFKALGIGAEASDQLVMVSEGLKLQWTFTDEKRAMGKKISSVSWHPTIHGLIAVTFIKKQEEQLDKSTVYINSPAFIVFYGFPDQSNPRLLLECPDDIFAFEFCPSNPNVIVGGCRNGKVVLWDISFHIPHLQGTRPNSKKASDSDSDTDTFDLGNKKENKTPVMSYCAVSSIESSHKSPVTDVQWLPKTFEVTRTGVPVQNISNMSVQVVTCSPDCVMFWDLRVPKLQNQFLADRKQDVDQKTMMTPYSIPTTFKHLDRTWKPLFRVSLPKIDTSGEYAPLKFSLEHYTCNSNTGRNTDNENDGAEVLPEYSQLRIPSAKTLKTLDDVNTKFYVGTEEGEIVYTDWKLEEDEFGRKFSAKPLLCFRTHAWFVNTMQRSPFFKDILLTTGGWNFAIWKEGVMGGPIFVGPSSEQEYSAACWSLSRSAVFFIGRNDGSIEVWNLLLNTSEPTHVHEHVASTRITCIKPCITASKQHYLAVADNLGVLRVFNVPKALRSPVKNEDLNMQIFFDQENDRLKDYLEWEELWAKPRKEEGESKKQVEPDKPVTFQVDSEEADLKEYSDYLKLEESILEHTGL
ncbi:dynein axonemal intermediate chain 3 isoform X2 [Astatotilapia calliptera]|uniref:dynein axonemal intermediate chain 3 isoform X2 n=1 Tax=Astatotilapia calliptera TaxID=8154 RepID=UPI000E409198|nr:WD repeat-containing protein 63 isoform X2 [Astatotilapia calliptera]